MRNTETNKRGNNSVAPSIEDLFSAHIGLGRLFLDYDIEEKDKFLFNDVILACIKIVNNSIKNSKEWDSPTDYNGEVASLLAVAEDLKQSYLQQQACGQFYDFWVGNKDTIVSQAVMDYKQFSYKYYGYDN